MAAAGRSQEPLICKVVLVGDARVGKSSLLSRWASDSFSEFYESTVSPELSTKEVALDGAVVRLQVWDTGFGEPETSAHFAHFCSQAAGAVLMYDVSDVGAADAVTHWHEEVKHLAKPTCVFLVVGCKADLRSNAAAVEQSVGQICKAIGAQHLETSAKTGFNVTLAFTTLARELQRRAATPAGVSTATPSSNGSSAALSSLGGLGASSLAASSSPVAPTRLLKILLLGDAGVGKSCLAAVLSGADPGSIPEDYVPTAGPEIQTRQLSVGASLVRIQLWDAAGNDLLNDPSVRGPLLFNADGALLIYDVSDKTSFDNLGRWMELLEAMATPKTALMLLGNKADGAAGQRMVTEGQGTAFADALRVPFAEVSTRNARADLAPRIMAALLERGCPSPHWSEGAGCAELPPPLASPPAAAAGPCAAASMPPVSTPPATAAPQAVRPAVTVGDCLKDRLSAIVSQAAKGRSETAPRLHEPRGAERLLPKGFMDRGGQQDGQKTPEEPQPQQLQQQQQQSTPPPSPPPQPPSPWQQTEPGQAAQPQHQRAQPAPPQAQSQQPHSQPQTSQPLQRQQQQPMQQQQARFLQAMPPSQQHQQPQAMPLSQQQQRQQQQAQQPQRATMFPTSSTNTDPEQPSASRESSKEGNAMRPLTSDASRATGDPGGEAAPVGASPLSKTQPAPRQHNPMGGNFAYPGGSSPASPPPLAAPCGMPSPTGAFSPGSQYRQPSQAGGFRSVALSPTATRSQPPGGASPCGVPGANSPTHVVAGGSSAMPPGRPVVGGPQPQARAGHPVGPTPGLGRPVGATPSGSLGYGAGQPRPSYVGGMTAQAGSPQQVWQPQSPQQPARMAQGAPSYQPRPGAPSMMQQPAAIRASSPSYQAVRR